MIGAYHMTVREHFVLNQKKKHGRTHLHQYARCACRFPFWGNRSRWLGDIMKRGLVAVHLQCKSPRCVIEVGARRQARRQLELPLGSSADAVQALMPTLHFEMSYIHDSLCPCM
jgi:hypothetical protein